MANGTSGMVSKKSWLVICSGSSIVEFKEQIHKFDEKHCPTTIGVNNIGDYFIPDYHLWVNKRRYKEHKNKVYPESKLVLGWKFDEKSYDKIKFKNIEYVTEDGQIRIEGDSIYGKALTGGTLAGAYAIMHGAEKLYYVGIDGIADRKHCYKERRVDKQDKLEILQKGTAKVLADLNNYVPLKILTPTVYKKYYEDIVNFL